MWTLKVKISPFQIFQGILECLQRVNLYRQVHQAQDLELDQDLCKQAAKWAAQLAEKDRLEHSPREDRENQVSFNPFLSCWAGVLGGKVFRQAVIHLWADKDFPLISLEDLPPSPACKYLRESGPSLPPPHFQNWRFFQGREPERTYRRSGNRQSGRQVVRRRKRLFFQKEQILRWKIRATFSRVK